MNEIEIIKERKKMDWIQRMNMLLDWHITSSNERYGIALDCSENSIYEIDKFCSGIHKYHVDEHGHFREDKIGCFDFMAVFITRIFESNYEVGDWDFHFELNDKGDYFVKKIEYVTQDFRFNPVHWIEENIKYGDPQKVSTKYFQMLKSYKSKTFL